MNDTVPYANSLFEQPWWLDIVAPGRWHEAIVEDGSGVIARMPYMYIAGGGGTILNPPFTQTMGIWLDESLKTFVNGNSQLHRQKEIIGALLEQLPKATDIHLCLDSSVDYVLPFRWHGFKISPSWSYRICDLQNTAEVNCRMGKTVVKNLKAARRNLIVRESDNFNELWALIDKTFGRQKRNNPINRMMASAVVEETLKNGHGKLLTACDAEGNVHSAGFFVFDEKTCYYLLGGQDPLYKSDGSQNLVLYEAIQFAATVSENFDFEGSMVEGIENFFRQFGGHQVTNYNISKKPLLKEWADAAKPHIKKALKYRI